MPELARQVDEFVSAGFTGLWVRTYEFHDAIDEIQATCHGRDWPCVVWDMEAGVTAAPETLTRLTSAMESGDNYFRQKPLPLIQRIPLLSERLDADRSVWILKNFHHQQLLGSLSMTQALQNCLLEYRHDGARTPCLIVMSPKVDIPMELEKDFQVLDFELPDKQQLWDIAANICEGNEVPLPAEDTDERRLILEAGSGMTRRNFENAVALSIAKHGELRQDLLWDLKSQDLKKRNLLQIYEGTETFDDLGGFDQFKTFSTRLLKPRDNPLLYSRGLLLLGVPGAGKSAAIKALGNATRRKVLFMDMGTLRSKWAGESDANVDQALKIADAMAPCILAIDEIEKALSGAGQSSSQTDGGMGDRLFGKMLSWLNDHTSDVFFVGTCLTGDTLVELHDGTIECLEDLAHTTAEFRSATLDGDWCTGTGEVVSRGIRPVLKLELGTGQLRATPDHTFFVFDSGEIVEKEAKDLLVGDLLFSSSQLPSPLGKYATLTSVSSAAQAKPIRQPERLTDDLAYFLGYCCGDGGLCKADRGRYHRLQVSEQDAAVKDRVLELVSSLFGVSAGIVDKRPEVQSYYMYFDSTPLVDWLLENFPTVLGPQESRSIPKCIMQAPIEAQIQFIAGLLDAEGHITDSRIAVGVTSSRLISELQLVLRRLDVQSTVSEGDREPPRKQVFRLSVSDARSRHQFLNHIRPALVHSQKRGALKEPREYGGNGCRSVPAMKPTVLQMLQLASVPTTVLPNFRNHNSLISADTVDLWWAVLNSLRNRVVSSADIKQFDNLRDKLRLIWQAKWVPVKAISAGIAEPVYDIVIRESHHSFFANGVVVHNCNNISMLPPEFSRAERFDGMFFFDVPTKQEREAIWQIYLQLYGLATSREDPVKRSLLSMSEGWTGAEIKACCRLSAILEVPLEEAAQQIVPVARAADEKLSKLREWASGRCMNASKPGLYDGSAKAVASVSPFGSQKTRRNISKAGLN